MDLNEIKEGFWECFLKQGKVEDYLRYSQLKHLCENVYGNDEEITLEL